MQHIFWENPGYRVCFGPLPRRAQLLPWMAIALFSTGCGDRVATTKRSLTTFPAVTIRVACPNEQVAKMVEQFKPSATSPSGLNVVCFQYDPNTEPGGGDVWIIPPARMPHFAAAEKLQPVPSDITTDDPAYAWDDILPLYRSKLLVWDGKVRALPFLSGTLLCYYREDLLKDPENQANFKRKHGRDLSPPATWEELLDMAEFFHNQKRPGVDHACPSLPAVDEANDALDQQFYALAVSYARRAIVADASGRGFGDEVFSFHYDLRSGQPRIDQPGFVHALEVFKRLGKFRQPGSSPEPERSFENGEAVFCVGPASWIGKFQKSRFVRDKFAFCQSLPGATKVIDGRGGKESAIAGGNHVPYLGAGGWLAVVPATSPNPEPAFRLIAALSNPRTSADIVIEPAWGGGVYRQSHLQRGIGWTSFGLSSARTEELVNCMRSAVQPGQVRNPVLRLRIPDERSHQLALLSEIRAALFKDKKPSQAIADAAAQWRDLDSKRPAGEVRTEYRLSLSLSRGE